VLPDHRDFKIETASWRDLKRLRQLEKECFGPDAWPLFDLLMVLSLPGIVRLKASVAGEMVAFVAGDAHPAEHVGWITTLGVRGQHRRKGIARALLVECEQRMAQPVVRLSVRRSNSGAIRLYQQAGYSQTGVWTRYYTGGEDALVLEKHR
jgi:ribosomal-protein-alanine N-acetyltransferase